MTDWDEDVDVDGLSIDARLLQDELDHLRAKTEALVTALKEIAYARERQPVKHLTGVSGEPRYLHGWPSRAVAVRALAAFENGRLAPRG